MLHMGGFTLDIFIHVRLHWITLIRIVYTFIPTRHISNPDKNNQYRPVPDDICVHTKTILIQTGLYQWCINVLLSVNANVI